MAGSGDNQVRDSAPQSWGQVILTAAQKWLEDDAATMGAAIAFYTLFSLSPVILTVLAVAGLVFGEEGVRDALYGQMAELIGTAGAQSVETLVRNAASSEAGALAVILGPVLFVLGATTVFVQLQAALNVIWKVEVATAAAAREGRTADSGSWHYARLGLSFLRQRLISFALIVGAGLLLSLMLTINAMIVALAGYLDAHVSLGLADRLWMVELIVSMIVQAGMFAAIFKILPDAPLAWIDVWTGAVISALLFAVGRIAISFYLARTDMASSYGAAGTLIVILFWVYYSAQIFLFGAELTWASRRRRLARIAASAREPRPPLRDFPSG